MSTPTPRRAPGIRVRAIRSTIRGSIVEIGATSCAALIAFSSVPLPAQTCYTSHYVPGTSIRELVVIDPWTGIEISSVSFNAVATSIANDSAGPLMVGNTFTAPWNNQLYRTNPADGGISIAGSTGLPLNTWLCADTDPVSGRIYAAYYFGAPTPNQLFEIDRATGTSSFIGVFSAGIPITALAIRSDGRALGASTLGFAWLDLADASGTGIGGPYPFPSGYYLYELAFDFSDQLWALVRRDVPHPAPDEYQLYQIDTVFGVATLISVLLGPGWYAGLAFVPQASVINYCSAKANSLGCLPTIQGDGYPSVSASTGFDLRATDVASQSNGVLVFGAYGAAATPFGGGTLCVRSPYRRSAVVSSGGSSPPYSDCSGVWNLDFNTWLAEHVPVPAGIQIFAQWIGRDSGFAAPNNWSLSDALRFTLRP
jgi:hypothetical protein